MRLQACVVATLAMCAHALTWHDAATKAPQALAQAVGGIRREGFCIEGKIVPRLYVAGAMKTGTTTTFNYFMNANVTNPCPWGQLGKECSFFNAGLNEVHGQERMESWLREMPGCPPVGVRQVLGDFTPTYLNAVPNPEGTVLQGVVYGTRSLCLRRPQPAWCQAFQAHTARPDDPSASADALSDMNAPRDIARSYGDLSRDLTFVVLLREPLSRMQSHWYFGAEGGFHRSTESAAPSFAIALNRTAARYLNTTGPRVIDDYMWPSMYAAQLRVWLEYFDPAQFVILPNDYLNSHAQMTSFCEGLEERLDFPMDCEAFGQGLVEHENTSPHPPLEEEPASARAAFEEVILPPLNSELFELLASMRQQGATLQGYMAQSTADAASVEKWLSDAW
mmetsp:Transcript_98296/g.254189  ORF Transcript_98296/g.254189 Transcript_98296/m.254189 type:complete len:393 (+) Transcript_98296:86-1264(+)